MPSLCEDNDSVAMDMDENEKSPKDREGLFSNQGYRSASNIKCAYVHISKALDNDDGRTPDLQFNKKFSLNSTISKLRILSSANWMDNVASCATADGIVSSVALTHSDLKLGAIYKQYLDQAVMTKNSYRNNIRLHLTVILRISYGHIKVSSVEELQHALLCVNQRW